MKYIKTEDAVGHVLCHDITKIIPGSFKGTGFKKGHVVRSEDVPLRYNYDKPEKPRISRVFGYLARFFILFQTEKSSREVVIS